MFSVLLLSYLAQSPQPEALLPRAHSHNDYYRKRPLLDALDAGFMSVEADVFLVDGRLLVGHSVAELKPERTLEALYLKPLAERLHEKKAVYAAFKGSFWVLIDIKQGGKEAFAAFLREVDRYPVLKSKRQPQAVRFVISGDRPVDDVLAHASGWLGLDGRLNESGQFGETQSPWVSSDWNSHFTWRGEGEMPVFQMAKLKALAKSVHNRKQLIRFWGAPDRPALWDAQAQANVDWIGTDRPADLRGWMIANNLHVTREMAQP